MYVYIIGVLQLNSTALQGQNEKERATFDSVSILPT